MDEVIQEEVEAAIARTLLNQMSGDVIERLRQEVWQQHREALEQQALEAVKAEQAHALQVREEGLRDRFATERKRLERELEDELECRYHAQQRELDADMAERITRLKAGREAWRGRAERAERLLALTFAQLLGDAAHKRYLDQRGHLNRNLRF